RIVVDYNHGQRARFRLYEAGGLWSTDEVLHELFVLALDRRPYWSGEFDFIGFSSIRDVARPCFVWQVRPTVAVKVFGVIPARAPLVQVWLVSELDSLLNAW